MPLGGKSYQPGTMPGAGPLRPGTDPQEAVQILNLRLPKRPMNSPIPGSLLTGAGGGGDASLNGLLRALMTAFGGARDGSGTREEVGPSGPGIDTGFGGARSIPPPRIHPGDQGTRTPVGDLGPPPGPPEPLFGRESFDPSEMGADAARTARDQLFQYQGIHYPLF